jgi:hypothetical protein
MDQRMYPTGRDERSGTGYKVARGEVQLDGANPTPVVTGLASIKSAVVTFKRANTPGLDPTALTVDFGGAVTPGVLNVYAWKPTGAADCTLIASTNATAVVCWEAVGE